MLSTKRFELVQDGLKITEKSLNKFNEYIVPFENIGNKTMKSAEKKNLWLVLTIVFVAFSISAAFDYDLFNTISWAILSLLSLSLYFLTSKNMIYLTGASYIEFFLNTQNNGVEKYIKEVINFRNSYLRNKYGKVEPDYPIDEQLFRFKKLLDDEVISEEEYMTLKADLRSGINSHIGFKI